MANHFLYESKTASSNPADVIFNNVYLNSINSTDGKIIIDPTTIEFLAEINQDLSIGANPSFVLTNSQNSITDLVNLATFGSTGNTVIAEGNLQILGTLTTVDTLDVKDPLIGTGVGNLTNTVDLGIYSQYSTDGKTSQYSGLARDHTLGVSGEYVLFNSLTEPTSVLGSYTQIPLNVSQLNGNVVGDLTGQVLTTTQDNITNLPFITDLGGSTFTNFSTLANINQALSTSSSPSFVNLTSNITGNLTGQVLTATQNLIISIPNLTTVGSLSSLTLNGTLNMNSNAITNATTVSATTISATTLAGTISTASQPNITTLAGITSIQSVAISPTQFGYLGALNQSLNTSSSPTFSAITGTLLTASQPNITTLAGITSIQSVAISPTQFGYLGSLNQSLTTSSSPTFANITGTLLTTAQPNVVSLGTLNQLLVSGTSQAEFRLDGIGDGSGAPIITRGFNSSGAYGGGVSGSRARGTLASPTGIASGDVITGIWGKGYNNVGAYLGNTGAIRIMANGTFTSTNGETYIDFATTPNSSVSRSIQMTLNGSGGLTVGSATDQASTTVKLYVNGASTHSGVCGIADGSVSLPSLAFTSNTSTGFYKIGTGNIGLSCSGTKIVDINSTQFSITSGSVFKTQGSGAFRVIPIASGSQERASYFLGIDSSGNGGWETGQSIGVNTIKDYYLYDANTGNTRMKINPTGGFTLNSSTDLASTTATLYVSGNTKTSGSLEVLNYASGTTGNIMAGSPTPTITPDAFSTVSNVSSFKWQRIGNQVSVIGSFRFTVTVAGSGQSSFNFSIPPSTFVASTFASTDNATGFGILRDTLSTVVRGNLVCSANVAGNYVLVNALLTTTLSSTVPVDCNISFSYQVI